MPQSYTDGQRLLGSDGQTYVMHNGVPVLESSVAPAVPRTFGTPDPTQDLKRPEVQAKISNTQTDTATSAAKLPYIAPQAAAEARKTQLEAAKIAQDLTSGPQVQSPQLQKQAQARGAINLLDNLDKQEALFRDKYVNNGPLDSMGRFFPTPTNRNFDQYSKNELVSGKAFLRVPGEGSSSDRDVTNYTDLLPGATSYDLENINRFQNLREQANAVLRDAGLPERRSNVLTPDGKVYVGPRDAQGRPAAAINPASQGGGGGAPPGGPERPDGSRPLAGGTSGGNTMSLSPGNYTTKLVDPPATAKASFNLLMRGKPTDDQMRQWGQKFGYDVTPYIEARRKNPNVAPTLGKTIQRVPLTGVAAGLNKVAASPLGAGMIGAGDAVTAGFLDNMTANPEQTRAVMGLAQQQNPGATLAGNLAGGALAAGGAELGLAGGAARLGVGGAARFAPLVADTLYGAANGAGNADNGNRLTGAALGATLGAAGGAAGRSVARGIGGAARGVQDASVQYLRSRGVPLTVGQALGQSGIFGKAVKGLEDRASGYSLTGDIVNARRTEGLEGFNRAAFKEGGEPIGFAPQAIGEQGVDAMGTASGQAYGDAVNGVSVTPDAQFAQDVGAAMRRGGGLPRVGPEFNEVVNSDIAPHFSNPTGTIDGPQIQDLLQNTRGTPFGNDAMGSRANVALNDIGGAVSDLTGRQAPHVIPKLRAANTGYRNLNILADAVGKGIQTDGIFTPAQLGMSARANATKFGGKLAAASENRPFFDLQRAGQNVLPSKVPDSGTAGRLALLAVPTLAGGAVGTGGGYAAGDTSTGAGLGSATGLLGALALAAGGSRAGQRILTKTLLDRPDFAVELGNKLIRRQGLFGAPMVAASQQFLPQ